MNEILPPVIDDIIVENGTPTVAFYIWIQQITAAIQAPLTGSGTPESNVIATVGRWYVDTGAAAGTGIYFKQTGEGNTGWVLRS
jgi:hypothetical protein|tara:strand:- start:7835 stop:8086 length:252 start_codon:yes stop_codon:yes gene_type:complete